MSARAGAIAGSSEAITTEAASSAIRCLTFMMLGVFAPWLIGESGADSTIG